MAGGQFQVTFAELTAAADQIAADNEQFRARVSEMEGYRAELAGMWEGEANTAFNNALTQDQEKWTSFSTLIDQYSQALRQVAQTLQQAEAESTQIAASRTY